MAASNSPAGQLITENIDIWTSAIKKRGSQGRGSSKKIELYGIKKLRELILELAVRGLLIPQDPTDEPASVLLEKIAAEKEQLIKDGKIKKQKALPEISEDEKSFELPNGWEWTRIPAVGHDWGQVKPDQTFTYIDVGSINKELGLVQNPNILSEENAPSRARKIVKEGTVIYSTIRPYLLNIAVINSEINPMPIASTAFAIIHPYSGISSSFIYRYLRSPIFISYVESVQTGVAYPAINEKQFSLGLFPLPPEAEQTRIVAKVDELMALCDQLEQQTEASLTAHQTLVETLLNTLLNADQNSFDPAWERIAQHFDVLFTTGPCGEWSIDQLKQTILQLAVMGKLVPQNPNDEPASVLLEKIAAEKEQLINDKVIKKQKPLPPIGEDEKPFELPKGWEWCRLGQLGFDMGGGTPSKGRSDYWNGHIPWISPKDMKVDYIDSSIDGITELAIQETVVNMVPENSLLVVVRGMILDHSFPVAINRLPVAINQDMKALVFSDTDKDFLLVLMKGFKTDFLDLVERSSHGTCKLISERLWSKVIAIPPNTEQPYIAARVNELITLCNTLKSRISETQTTQLHLANAMAEQALN